MITSFENKTILLLFCAVATLFVSCHKEEMLESQQNCIIARIESVGTKTSFDGTQGKLTWTNGDRIAVCFSDGTYTDYDVTSDGTLNISSTSTRFRDYFAVYPASASVAGQYGEPDLQVTLPSTYDISNIVEEEPGNPGADFSPMPMVAVNDESSSFLDFYHVGGLLRITLNGIKAETKTATVTFDKDVTGTYTVSNPDTTEPTITTAGEALNNVVTYTLASSSVGSTSTVVVLNVPVPCGTYESVTVKLYNSTGTAIAVQKYDESPLVFARHHGKKLSFGELIFDFKLRAINNRNVTYSGGQANLSSFYSYKTADGGSTKIPVPITVEYLPEGETVWSTTPPAWLDPSGIDLEGNTEAQPFILTAAALLNSAPDMHHNAMVANGTYETAHDLSTFNVATGQSGTISTANCYVVDRPGNYKLPLVYGNAIDWRKNPTDGINEVAYHAKRTTSGAYIVDGDTQYLGHFKDHLDHYITTPYIAEQLSGKTLSAALVWTDSPGLIDASSLSITDSGQDAYLNFEVPEDYITQGNALVAVLADGVIAWSWHIWVTDESLTAMATEDVSFAPMNLGWVEGKTEKYEPRTCQVRVTQSQSGLSSTATLTQTGKEITTLGNNLFYQWGRKDPQRATNGVSFSVGWYRFKVYYPGPGYDLGTYPGQSEAVSLGKAIQNPYKFFVTDVEDPDFGYVYWCDTQYVNNWNSVYNGEIPVDYFNRVTKTIYDPSPVGYVVPGLTAFEDFYENGHLIWDNDRKGRYYHTNPNFFIPAPGYISEGYVYGVCDYGHTGNFWTAVPYTTEYWGVYWATGLSFDNQSINTPGETMRRSTGLSVRPVIDEQ